MHQLVNILNFHDIEMHGTNVGGTLYTVVACIFGDSLSSSGRCLPDGNERFMQMNMWDRI